MIQTGGVAGCGYADVGRGDHGKSGALGESAKRRLASGREDRRADRAGRTTEADRREREGSGCPTMVRRSPSIANSSPGRARALMAFSAPTSEHRVRLDTRGTEAEVSGRDDREWERRMRAVEPPRQAPSLKMMTELPALRRGDANDRAGRLPGRQGRHLADANILLACQTAAFMLPPRRAIRRP
jgi:hypothetical protein